MATLTAYLTPGGAQALFSSFLQFLLQPPAALVEGVESAGLRGALVAPGTRLSH